MLFIVSEVMRGLMLSLSIKQIKIGFTFIEKIQESNTNICILKYILQNGQLDCPVPQDDHTLQPFLLNFMNMR